MKKNLFIINKPSTLSFCLSFLTACLLTLLTDVQVGHARSGGKIYVVSTLTDYAAIAMEIGGDRVRVEWAFEGWKRAIKIQRIQ